MGGFLTPNPSSVRHCWQLLIFVKILFIMHAAFAKCSVRIIADLICQISDDILCRLLDTYSVKLLQKYFAYRGLVSRKIMLSVQLRSIKFHS